MLRKTINPYELTLDEYREIVNLPTHVIAIIKPNVTFYKVNERANPVLGWDPEEAIGRSVKDFIHPDDWDRTLGIMTGLFIGSSSLVKDFVTRCRHKDGDWRWISWTAKVKRGLIYSLGTDVTEKVEYEEALTVQSLVLESISEAVTITNSKGTIVFANTAAEKLFGYATVDLLGQSFLTLSNFPEDLSRMYLQDALRSISGKGIWSGEWQNKRYDGGTLITACRVTTLDLKGERHYVCVQRDITENKKSQKEWQDLQTRFRTFFEQSLLPMEIYDLEGNPLEVNQAWEKVFNTTRDQIKGYNILTDPTSKATGIYEYVLRAYAGEAVEVPPFRMDPAELNREGRARWLTAWFSPVKDEAGKVRELAMILKDVTEERETQEALAFSNAMRLNIEERLSMAVKVGKIGIWEWLPGKDKVIWDETTEHIFGYEKGTFPGDTQTYTSHIYVEDREKLWKTVQSALERKISYDIDHQIITKNGSKRWVQSSGIAFYDNNGNPYRIMGTVLDITERKHAEEDQKFLAMVSEILSSSLDFKDNLQRFSEAASRFFSDGCFIDQLNADGNIERVIAIHSDPEKVKLLIQKPPRSLEHYEDNHPLLGSIVSGKTILYQDLRKSREELIEQMGEEFTTEALTLGMTSAMTLRLRGRESLLGTMTFFTTEGYGKRFDQRHLNLAEELAYRVSMSFENSLLYLHSQEAIRARDEFLSIASHELKTPLQSLTLQNQMRKRQIEKGHIEGLSSEKLLKSLDMDNRQLTRINRLIDDMLEITRIQADRLTLNKETFEFCQFLKEIEERFRPQMEAAGCEVTTSLCKDVHLFADSYRIEQVVVNLLTNAMKYGAGRPIKIEVAVNAKKLTLFVHDKGPGIDPKDLERIFDRFERAISSSEVSGLGLGLFISRQIIEQHEGSLTVESELGQGSTFIVELPLTGAL